MPSVNPGESQKSYVGRCIPIVLKEGTAKDQNQAAAICFSMYRDHKKKSKASPQLESFAESLRDSIAEAKKNKKSKNGKSDKKEEEGEKEDKDETKKDEDKEEKDEEETDKKK